MKKAFKASARAVREFEDRQYSSGYVKLSKVLSGPKITIWRRQEDCVRTNKGWVPKIEFVMYVFGPEKINRILRKNVQSLFMTKEQASRYKTWLDKMTEKALDVSAKRSF